MTLDGILTMLLLIDGPEATLKSEFIFLLWNKPKANLKQTPGSFQNAGVHIQ